MQIIKYSIFINNFHTLKIYENYIEEYSENSMILSQLF